MKKLIALIIILALALGTFTIAMANQVEHGRGSINFHADNPQIVDPDREPQDPDEWEPCDCDEDDPCDDCTEDPGGGRRRRPRDPSDPTINNGVVTASTRNIDFGRHEIFMEGVSEKYRSLIHSRTEADRITGIVVNNPSGAAYIINLTIEEFRMGTLVPVAGSNPLRFTQAPGEVTMVGAKLDLDQFGNYATNVTGYTAGSTTHVNVGSVSGLVTGASSGGENILRGSGMGRTAVHYEGELEVFLGTVVALGEAQAILNWTMQLA